MGLKANALKIFLKEKKPGFYRELKASGTLEQYCREAEDRAEEQKLNLMQQGWADYEADEIVRAQMFESPPNMGAMHGQRESCPDSELREVRDLPAFWNASPKGTQMIIRGKVVAVKE